MQDDFVALAGMVVQALCDGPRLVWVADDDHVYSAAPDVPTQVPASWIVRTFAMGHPVADIHDDIRAVASERARHWILY